ncbi:MAG: hypothetical protein ACOX7U_01030 [Desulfitobacteriia bacterium]
MKTILTKYDDFFLRVAEPIIENEEYQKMKEIPHHYGSVFEHSLDVAYLAYRISQKLIVNHMFPVGLPRSYEAWVTTFADKCLAIKEYYTRLYSLIYLGMRRAILQKY